MILGKNIKRLSDNELVQRYKSSENTEYLGELYNRYMPLVYGCCLKYLKNTVDAQDAVMQIFEELLVKVLKHTIDNFKAWLYMLSKNYCLMQLRGSGKYQTVNIEDGFMEIADNFHLDIVMDDERKAKALDDCIEALPPPQRMGIVKFFMESLSYKDICDSTGFDLNKVKSYIQNGKRNLKLCLEKKGIKAVSEV